MGQKYVTASGSLIVGPALLTSIAVNATGTTATVTVYNATAATANTEIIVLQCGTGLRSVCWSDPRGLEVDNAWVTITGCFTTIVWE